MKTLPSSEVLAALSGSSTWSGLGILRRERKSFLLTGFDSSNDLGSFVLSRLFVIPAKIRTSQQLFLCLRGGRGGKRKFKSGGQRGSEDVLFIDERGDWERVGMVDVERRVRAS